ncbi:MAG: hypothetical protein JWQ84_290 [Mucilaginibacter sp.]|nr:hypothetical protein [Mucilaginibacter sp.]
MKNDKLIPGLVLVLIGAAILLSNYGYLHFHWYNVFRLWPIFLIIGGVNLVFAHNRSPWATIVKITVVVVGLGLLFFGNFGNRYNFWPGNHFGYYHNDNNDNNDDSMDDGDNNDDNSDSSNVTTAVNGAFNEPYTAGIKVARLNISGGGTAYYLSDTTNQLFNAAVKNNNGRYEFTHSKDDDSVYVLDFHMKDHNGFQFGSHNNEARIRLNPNPEWEINVEAGATALNFDLSKFNVSKFKINGGAASFDVKLGAPLTLTDVEISTGVSSVNISIPQGAACSIETDSGLSDNHFTGFNKTSDNNYETPGFNAATHKMHIHISGGLSDFKVNRY